MPRWEFLPVTAVYNAVTTIRNKFFDWGILPSKKYSIPVIGIGNLSTGGTGKSPHTIYVLNLVKDQFRSAMVSRGYGRKTKGLQVANYQSTYRDIGDEPMQVYSRFRNKVVVIVSEKRTKGIDYAIQKFNTNCVVLDDCFQHRYVNPGLKILLTAYGDLYSEDYVLPVGNLRESRSNAKRADIIIVSKCPSSLSDSEKSKIKDSLAPASHQSLYFSFIDYADKIINSFSEMHLEELENYEVLLVTGIANAQPLVDFLRPKVKNLIHLSFKDHHNFDEAEVEKMYEKLQEIKGDKVLITTEKDFMRLKGFKRIEEYLYYIPIESKIENSQAFNQKIYDYVGSNH